MNLIQSSDFERDGAAFIADVIRAKPDAAIVVATGNTPMGIYRTLASMYRKGAFTTNALRILQLDEYLGVPVDDRRSLFRWMWEAFCMPLDIPASNIIRLPGNAADPAAACQVYKETVRSIGVDLSILGLGPNGHLGFNEPPAGANAPTRVVELTEESLNSNAAYWGGRDHVPTQALTCGMDVLLTARQTLLVVSGAHKRSILQRALGGPVTPDVPASFLQNAANVTVLADAEAAGSLRVEATP